MTPSAASARSTPSRPVHSSLRRRILRVVIPLIFLVFAGLAVAFAAYALLTARTVLIETHERGLTELRRSIDERLDAAADVVTRLARSAPAREFGRSTLINVTGSQLQAAQDRLLADLVALLTEFPDQFIAARYVTYTGTVWSEVTRYSTDAPLVDSRVQIGAQQNDAYTRRAQLSDPGTVVIAPLAFVDSPGLMRLLPYVRLITPVTSGSSTTIAGTLQVDLQLHALLDPLNARIADLAAQQDGRRVIIADSDNRVIIDTGSRDRALIRDIATNNALMLPMAAPDAAALIAESAGRIQADPALTIVNLAAVRGGSAISSTVVLQPDSNRPFWNILIVDDIGRVIVSALRLPLLVGAGLLLLAGALSSVIYGLSRRVLDPVQHVSELAERITRTLPPVSSDAIYPETADRGGGDAPASMTLILRRKAPGAAATDAPRATAAPIALPEPGADLTEDGEVGQLFAAFQLLSQRVNELNHEIVTQVGRYSRNLDIASRIGRETATLYDTDVLLNRAINLICDEFGFYHAQVFLIDEIGKNAVLVYSRGEIGQELLARKHKLGVGSDSVIGRVTASGRPVIVNDTQVTAPDQPYYFNPLLPETRAELALPLQIGDRIIGALDIQSTEPNVFHQEDLSIFQLLADQIAIALENARLIVETERRYQQIDELNRQLTRIAWEDTPARSHLAGIYRYDLMNVERLTEPDGEPSTDELIADTELRVPIKVRGEVIGVLDVETDGQAQFSESDRAIVRAVADRVAIAIEAARLFEETQTNLAETSTLYQLSRYLSEASTLQDILNAIIVSVMPDATSAQIAVFDDYPVGSKPVWAQIRADWSLEDALNEKSVGLEGLMLRLPDHPLLQAMTPDQVVIVSDVDRDNRLDEILRAIMQDVHGRAMVIIPFSVRGIWRGLILVEFPERREFTEREGRIYTALIDQAGVAIDNRLLLAQNELALAQIERLYTSSRQINMAQTLPELVQAALAARQNPQTSFMLGLFEGDLGPTGWPGKVRIVAYSIGDDVLLDDVSYDFPIAADSPLIEREPLIAVDRLNAFVNDGPTALQRFMRARGIGFMAAFPLFSANQPIGLFFVTHPAPQDLSDDDAEVYRALTGQMSVVLQNRRLLEQTAAALDETRRLYTASRAIAEAADSAAIYAAVVRHVDAPNLLIQRISVLRAAPVSSIDAPFVEFAHIDARPGVPVEFIPGQRLPRHVVPVAELLAGGAALRIDHIDAVPAAQRRFAEMLAATGSTSFVLTPIRTRTRWFGAILVESEMPAAFDDSYVRFTQAVADQAALALEGAELFREARAEAQRALALAEAGQLANRISGEFRTALADVFARIAEAGEYDRWGLLLADESGDRLNVVLRALPGQMITEFPVDQFFSLDNPDPLVDAYRLGQTQILNDPAARFGEVGAEFVGKRILAPIRLGDQTLGVLYMGRSIHRADIDERDVQLASTLAAQVAVTLENQRLFRAAESERERLRTILETLPTGVLVFDAATLRPIQANQQAERLLGRPIDYERPFDVADYGIYRTGRTELYPVEELPILAAARYGQRVSADDIAVGADTTLMTDLLVNAAPITDEQGTVTAIVAAFEDITALRSLEKTLQINLRDSIALYEATRALSEAQDTDDVLEELIARLAEQEPSDALIVLLDEEGGGAQIARALSGRRGPYDLPDELLDAAESHFVDQIELAPHLLEAPAALEALRARGIAAYISIPLRARAGVPGGWVLMTFSQPQVFTPEREQFLSTLSDAAAVAIDNRRLFRSTNRALEETAALYRATNAINRASDLDELAQSLQSALETLKPDIYAAVLETASGMRVLFNVDLDGDPLLVDVLLARHHLLERNYSTFIDDLRTVDQPTPFEVELLLSGTIRAIGLVQMRSGDRLRGAILVGYHAPHRFTSGDARYLNALADAASVVANNILLLEQVQRTLQETSILYNATRDLANAEGYDQILTAIVNHLPPEMVSTGMLALLNTSRWDSADAAVTIAAMHRRDGAVGLDLNGVTLYREQFPAWDLLASPEVIAIGDIETEETIDEAQRAGILTLELRSLVIVPLRVSTGPLGAVVFGSAEPYVFTERERRIFATFAEQASLRLQASRLLAQTERRARQLATSAQVGQIASSILELDELLPRIVDIIREAFNYDHTQIFLMDEDDEWAVLRASTGEAGRKLLSINHRLQKGSASVIGQVTATGQPTIAADTADARVVHRPNPYLPNTRSEMAIPLILKGRVVGALDVQSNKPNAFDDDDVAALTTLAAQIAVAIDNASLFRDSVKRANEMSFLFTVTDAAASAATVTEALQKVADQLRQSLNSASVSIYLPVEYMDKDENIIPFLKPVALSGPERPLTELEEINLHQAQTSLIASAASTRRPLILRNLQDEARYKPVTPEARSAIIVPLISGASLIGVIAAESHNPSAYDNDTLTLLLTLSGTLSAIVQNQELLEQVQKQNEALRELDRLKSDFLANMSHELRTPLNSIIGFSRVILKGIDGPLTEMQEQDLSTIYNSGLHLLNLINDILDQAKIAAGKMDLQLDYFEMKHVIDGVRSIGIGLVKDKPIDIHVEIAPGLPKAYGDEFRTRQVLLNLISNAAKFTREGSITIRAYPTTHEDGRAMLRVDVTDTGIGIAEKDIPLLFEAFRQVDSSLTRTAGGTGLGLPIAKSLIEMMSGEMRVESQVNVGSTFSVLLPLEPAAPAGRPGTDQLREQGTMEPEAPAQLEPQPRGTGLLSDTPSAAAVAAADASKEDTGIIPRNQRPARTTEVYLTRPPMPVKRQILLIEDNIDMVDQFRRNLQREGFDIFAASIPLEAEAMASGLHPTLIIMDVNFANGTGWSILERLKQREDTVDIPVIVVSLNDDYERMRALDVFAYIQRPFTPEELIKAVQEAERASRVERILIIDDDPIAARLMEQIIGAQGTYRVFTARSGMEGIAMVARRRPSLVLLDLRMPDMDGFDVIQELRANPETTNIPILVVTGEASLTAEERERLTDLRVIYKTEFDDERVRPLLDSIRGELQSQPTSGD
ncbi:MAG: GAF domain-containing protein [Candidatus Flexifilum sp.]